MPSRTVEDYLKQIYHEQQRGGRRLVPMGRLATAVGVTPGTATIMIKTLTQAGLVNYEPRTGARLSRKGEQLALHVLRRHRLVELFLVQVLNVDWSDVHDEAEELEHAISDQLLERIAEFLGNPTVDPHGDPIPRADGTVAAPRLLRLTDCKPGAACRVARVMDQDARFLRFIEKQGLKPGANLRIESLDTQADSVTLRLADDSVITLGGAAAGKILVTS